MANIEKINGEFVGGVDVKGDVATCTYSVREKTDGDRHKVVSKVDFTGMSREDLIRLATRDIVIRLQGQFRTMRAAVGDDEKPDHETRNNAMKRETWADINVKAMLAENGRKRKSPEQKARDAIAALRAAGLSEKDIMAMLKAAA